MSIPVKKQARATQNQTAARAVQRSLRNPYISAVVLVLALAALMFVNDPNGTLGTDTGIKVATLRVMEQNSTLKPDLGYWAAPWDPAATAHPFRDARAINGLYVGLPTVPMVVSVYPIWRIGGYRLGLLLPILGLLGCALVARSMARRLPESDGSAAFWLVGLASPLVLYGLDLWEHSIGVAAMATAILVLYDELERPKWWRGFLSGTLFGAAFSMRTEALVYTVVTFATLAIVLVWRRRLRDVAVMGTGGIVGFIAVFFANIALEVSLIGQTVRSSRVAGTASGGASDLALRAKEAAVTLFSPFPTFDAYYVTLGVIAGFGLVAAARWAAHPSSRRIAICAFAMAALVYFTRVSFNPGFWPGLIATTPLAAVGLARGWVDTRTRLFLLLALMPLPLIFLFQFPGGALPQWGGRYLLTTGFLLMVTGAALLPQIERWARIGFVGLSVAITCIGLAWMSTRTHQVARAGELLGRLPESVVVAPDGFLAREFAATYGDKDWLSAPSFPETTNAVDVVRASGRTTFALITIDPSQKAPEYEGFHATGTSTIPFIDPVNLTITSYTAD